ncbi:MAG: DUF5333 domain-containing protein [Pseudomonadota bacterium]
MRKLINAALILGLCAGQVAANETPLTQNKRVMDGFYIIGTADIIRKACGRIDARMVRALMYLGSLQRYAKEQGYSEEQIDAFLDDDAQEDALRARIKSDLAARGVPDGDAEAHCRVGMEEIAADTPVGRLLRTKN